jgi:hypothetical protein
MPTNEKISTDTAKSDGQATQTGGKDMGTDTQSSGDIWSGDKASPPPPGGGAKDSGAATKASGDTWSGQKASPPSGGAASKAVGPDGGGTSTKETGAGTTDADTGSKTQALADSKTKKDAEYSKTKDAGSSECACPEPTDRWLKVKWRETEVYCGDPANLLGTAKGIKKEVEGVARVQVEKRMVTTLKDRGQTSFELEWPMVCGIDFKAEKKGEPVPEKLPADAKLSADGMSAETPKALAVKRLPDKDLEQVNIACSSPKSVNGTNNYGWTANFRLGVKDTDVLVRMTLQVKKAWLGKWISFAAADKLKQATGYIKKVGGAWKYYDTGKKAWEALPRNVSNYKINSQVFVQSGKAYVGRDDASKTWPEAFADSPDFETKKTAWLKNIHQVWDDKFKFQRKDLKGTARGCCEWPIDVKVNWSNAAGDKEVYIIWAQEAERSNARDWYLTYPNDGVAGHECGHLLAAYDEYSGGAIHPKTKLVENNSIMGNNLTTGKPRHLDDLRQEMERKVKAWIGRDWKLETKDK